MSSVNQPNHAVFNQRVDRTLITSPMCVQSNTYLHFHNCCKFRMTSHAVQRVLALETRVTNSL